MNREFQYAVVFAFSNVAGYGNPAGILWNPEGLSDMDRQQISKNNNLSETAFLFLQDDPDVPYKIKFNTPVKSIDMCGHASIAAAYAYWQHQGMPDDLSYQQSTDVGLLKIRIHAEFAENVSPIIMLEMDQPLLTEDLTALRAAMANLLGLEFHDLDEQLPLKINEKGYVFIPVNSLVAIKKIKPDFAAMKAFDELHGIHGWYVFTSETENPEKDYHCRFFAPYYGVNEDPVTGTANAYFMTYYLQVLHPELLNECVILNNEQGYEIGMNGTVRVEYTPQQNGKSSSIWIGGHATEYLDGRIMYGGISK